jgi:hypothetical protein
MKTEKVSWRGTPGVGDFMWALNSCHVYAQQKNIKIELEMHWEHGEDYYHHFEDPETIIERMDYIHNFYTDKDRVKVIHVFNSTGRYTDWKYDDDVVLEPDGTKRVSARSGNKPKNRFWFESGAYDDLDGTPVPDNDYIFRKSAFQTTVKNRIVVWTPVMNAEAPRTWKRLFTARDWRMLINELKENGFEVHEITYRTPIREAMYLISTARMCICYDGMWHYVAKNFARPMAVISPEGVTLYHTPNALRCHPLDTYDMNIWWWMDHFSDFLGHSKKKAIDYEENMRIRYGNE